MQKNTRFWVSRSAFRAWLFCGILPCLIAYGYRPEILLLLVPGILSAWIFFHWQVKQMQPATNAARWWRHAAIGILIGLGTWSLTLSNFV